MFASYRLEISQTQFGSEGSLAINNTLQLPDDKVSIHSFRAALLNSVEELLPKIFEAYLLNKELKETLDQRLSEEASLLESEPVADFSEGSEVLLEETEMLAAGAADDEEWLERYSRQL